MNQKYQWDLEHALENDTYEALEAKYLKKLNKLASLLQENPFKTIEDFATWNKQEEKCNILSSRISCYLINNIYANMANEKFNAYHQALSFKTVEADRILATFANVVLANKTKIKKYLKEPQFSKYQRKYQLIFDTEKHLLSDEVEKYQSNFDPLSNSYGDIFSKLMDQNLDFGTVVDSKNKKHKIVNRETYISLLSSKDRVLRKNAYHQYMNTIDQYKDVLGLLLYNFYLEKNIAAKTRNFKGYIDSVNFADEIDNNFVPHVYQAVAKYNQSFAKFQKLTAKWLEHKYQLDKFQPYDRFLDVADSKEKYSIETAQSLAKESLAILGDDYVKNMQKAFDEKWIDWEIRPNKLSGAYCWSGTKGLNKVNMLLNFKHRLDDVSTLVHEMGHAMHKVEYKKHQDLYGSSSILVAEIPSIANEVMFNYSLLKKYHNNPLKKLKIYEGLLNNFFGCTSRQMSFSEFEYQANELINNGKPFNATIAKNIYFQTLNKYCKDKPESKMPTGIKNKALSAILTIPHFYSGVFYVYKYAIGQVGAIIIANRIFNQEPNALNNYYQFLRSGSALSPLKTIELLGFDLTKDETWDECHQIVKKWLKEYQNIINYLIKKQK